MDICSCLEDFGSLNCTTNSTPTLPSRVATCWPKGVTGSVSSGECPICQGIPDNGVDFNKL
uniref:Uncharacterized protein n=1 Tax=Leptobrachium leishanense TaxID=445787 RepID=A0A8C5QPL5_9ANUR